MSYELYFLKSLALTILIETVVLFVFTRYIFKRSDIQVWVIILAGITASCATLPYLWFIFPLFLKTKLYYSLLSELFAVTAESLILLGFLRTGYVRALILSLLCNVISYSIGLIINLH